MGRGMRKLHDRRSATHSRGSRGSPTADVAARTSFCISMGTSRPMYITRFAGNESCAIDTCPRVSNQGRNYHNTVSISAKTSLFALSLSKP